MKKLLILLLLFTFKSNAQIGLQIRGGSTVNSVNPFFAPAASFSAHGLTIYPEMKVYIKRDAPVNFGAKIGYTYKFIEIGYGRYFDLYSTDAYDKFRNEWRNLFFVSIHYNNLFLEYDYLKGSSISAGIKAPIEWLQN